MTTTPEELLEQLRALGTGPLWERHANNASTLYDALASVVAERDRLREELEENWRAMERVSLSRGEPPRDGKVYYGAPERRPYKWVRYKPGAPKHLLAKGGRWKAMNEYGGWDNAQPPAFYQPEEALPTPPEEEK